MTLQRRTAISACISSLVWVAIHIRQVTAQEAELELNQDDVEESSEGVPRRPRTTPPEEYRDINYWPDGPGDAESHQLDVYPAATQAPAPILVFVHGGAWKIGSKEHVQGKPAALNKLGIHFVTTNYRLHPQGDYRDQAADVAHAIAWVHQHATEFGGDPRKIVLMGHSAGAHLAALVAIDDRYLQAAALSPAVLRGVILLDGAGYDIPQQIQQTTRRRSRTMYETIFTTDREVQKDASPITHVAAGRGTPPFLMFHVQHRWDSKTQAENLAKKLEHAGITAKVIEAHQKTHVTINREFGNEGDQVTEESLVFLNRVTHTP